MAFAIRDGVASGVIGKGALAPIQPGPKGYWRAIARLKRFAQTFAETVEPSKLPQVSVLLNDSRLWARLRPGRDGYEIDAHTLGPAIGDVVIVTNEFILAAINDGSLTASHALDLGVVARDGETATATWVQVRMLAQIALRNAWSDRISRKLLTPWRGKHVGSQ